MDYDLLAACDMLLSFLEPQEYFDHWWATKGSAALTPRMAP